MARRTDPERASARRPARPPARPAGRPSVRPSVRPLVPRPYTVFSLIGGAAIRRYFAASTGDHTSAFRSSVGGCERVTGRRPMAAGRSLLAPLSSRSFRALPLYSKVMFVRYFAPIVVINCCNRVISYKFGEE